MRNLASLLERVSKILNKDTFTKGAIISVIQKNTKADLPETSISLKEGVLSIIASSPVKNEITLKEKAIQDELKNVYKIFITRFLYK